MRYFKIVMLLALAIGCFQTSQAAQKKEGPIFVINNTGVDNVNIWGTKAVGEKQIPLIKGLKNGEKDKVEFRLMNHYRLAIIYFATDNNQSDTVSLDQLQPDDTITVLPATGNHPLFRYEITHAPKKKEEGESQKQQEEHTAMRTRILSLEAEVVRLTQENAALKERLKKFEHPAKE